MTDSLPIAHGYNKPDRATDREASFNDLASAQAYADAYGGEIEARGVAFVVREADHDKALDDLAEAQKVAPKEAPSVASDVDERIARAIAAESAKLRADFEAERAAWLAEHGSATPETVNPDAQNPA